MRHDILHIIGLANVSQNYTTQPLMRRTSRVGLISVCTFLSPRSTTRLPMPPSAGLIHLLGPM